MLVYTLNTVSGQRDILVGPFARDTGASMDTQDIVRRILLQRMERYTDPGPALAPVGSARFRMESDRLRVAYASAQPGQAAALVATLLNRVRPERLDIHWTVVPQRAGEEELAPALLAKGFTLVEDLLLMAHEGPIEATRNPLVSVAQITTRATMRDYEYGSRQCFYDDADPMEAVVLHRAQQRWREQERGWCRYYTARLHDTHVGGCYVSLYEDIPTLMGVYTLPHARGQGVATALLAQMVADIITPRRPVCCLFVEHGNPAERLYHQLGFVPLADSRTYAVNHAGPFIDAGHAVTRHA